jgi:hypothetical protein
MLLAPPSTQSEDLFRSIGGQDNRTRIATFSCSEIHPILKVLAIRSLTTDHVIKYYLSIGSKTVWNKCLYNIQTRF